MKKSKQKSRQSSSSDDLKSRLLQSYLINFNPTRVSDKKQKKGWLKSWGN